MNIHEAENYTKTYRLIAQHDEIKAYNERTNIVLQEPVSFDSKKDTFSCVDHFTCALASELLLCIKAQSKRENTTVLDLESKTEVNIKNPLTCLQVIGYEDIPFIDTIAIKIYAFSFLEKQQTIALFERAIRQAVLYNTVHNTVPIKLEFEIAT